MGLFCMPENLKVVSAFKPQSSNGGITSDTVSMQHVQRAWVVLHISNAGAADTTDVTIYQATSAEAAAANATTAATYKIWVNAASSSSDTLIAQTDAYMFSTTTAQTDQVVVFQIDPLDLVDTYDCVQVRISDTSTASNYADGMFYLLTTYPSATPPAAIST